MLELLLDSGVFVLVMSDMSFSNDMANKNSYSNILSSYMEMFRLMSVFSA